MTPLLVLRAAALAFAALATSGCQSCDKGRPAVDSAGALVLRETTQRCAAAKDVSFIVASDTHFGFSAEVDARNYESITAMNAMEGTPWPAEVGGQVGAPCGVLVSGDLTEDGKPDEWSAFVKAFGLRGGDGALKHPVFESLGNHDKNFGFFVRDRVFERHGSTVYSFDWGPLHLVSLGEAPDDEDMKWLKDDLAKAPRDSGIVLYFHFPLEGPYSTGQWFGDGAYREKLGELLAGRKIAGIFHGHYHATGIYEWKGFDVYRIGSPKHSWHTFTVVGVADGRMKVGSWSYDSKSWVWWHSKPMLGEGAEVRYVDPRVPP